MSTVVENYSGKKLNLMFPDPADIDIRDIAKQLSQMCRYNGACRWFYSVAQHSVHCLDYAKEIGIKDGAFPILLHILLHDAHEAYFGDLTSPTQALIEDVAPGVIDPMKARIQNAILVRLGLPMMIPEDNKIVDHVDRALRTIEAATLMVSRGADWTVREVPRAFFAIAKFGCDHAAAERAFLEKFEELLPSYTTLTPTDDELGAMRRRLRDLQDKIRFPEPIKPERIHQDQGADVELDQ